MINATSEMLDRADGVGAGLAQGILDATPITRQT